MTLETANEYVGFIYVGLCLFCGNLLLLRREHKQVYLPLALLFLFQGVSVLTNMVFDTFDTDDKITLTTRLFFLTTIFDIVSPFLFWLYVRGLTSEEGPERLPKLRYHIIPIVILWLLMCSGSFIPAEAANEEITEDHPAAIAIVLITLAIIISDLLFRIMVGIYLFLTIRRLRIYNRRLRDVFASTENRELTWIWAITFGGIALWGMNVTLSVTTWAGIFSEVEPDTDLVNLIDSFALLAFFWIIGVWGLRQRPGLTREPVVTPPEPEEMPVQKYEKSALDDDRAARIAQKIEAAMKNDLLYREPNLSLWDLAKHIGVTSHYVSQTLNTTLKSSFFDYINRWRIKDAVKQLNSSDETILMIAYDVGFNSRSAFYKAFKRETGKTPSDLRN